jgi:hypothetical protein
MAVPRKAGRQGQLLIPVAAGPMGTCTKDLALVMQVGWVVRRRIDLGARVCV